MKPVEKAAIENAVIAWQVEVPEGKHEDIFYDHYDASTKTVFMKRKKEFPLDLLNTLRQDLKKLDPNLMVSTIFSP